MRRHVLVLAVPLLMAPGDGCPECGPPGSAHPDAWNVGSPPLVITMTIPGSGTTTIGFTATGNADAFPTGGFGRFRPDEGRLVVHLVDPASIPAGQVQFDSSIDGTVDNTSPIDDTSPDQVVTWYSPDVACAPGCQRSGRLVFTRTAATPLTITVELVAQVFGSQAAGGPSPAVTLDAAVQ